MGSGLGDGLGSGRCARRNGRPTGWLQWGAATAAGLLALLSTPAHADPRARTDPRADQGGTPSARAHPPPRRQPRQPARPAPTPPEDLLPLSQFEDDPIGVGATRAPLRAAPSPASEETGTDQATPQEDQAEYGPQPPGGRISNGPGLFAASGVREVEHSLVVDLARHRATVRIAMRFEHRLDKPAEVRRLLPVPSASHITQFEVCGAGGCREGHVAGTGDADVDAYDAAVLARPASRSSKGRKAAPLGRVRLTAGGREATHLGNDTSNRTLVLDAAPVTKGAPLTVNITLQVPTAQHGGVVQLRWPAQAMDPHVAPRNLRVRAPGLVDVQPASATRDTQEDPEQEDPWHATAIRGRVPPRAPVQAVTTLSPCPDGPGRCARLQVDAGPRALRPADVILAIDVSPSMEGPARSRLAAALAALLEAMPEGSRVRALRFAGRAEPLWSQPMPPDSVSLASFRPALQAAELGSATRVEAAMGLARRLFRAQPAPAHAGSRLPRLLVMMGDGGATLGERGDLQPAGRGHLEMSVVNLADRDCHPALVEAAARAGGTVVEAGPEAEAGMRGRGTTRLQSKLQALFAARISGPLTLANARARQGKAIVLPGLRAGGQLSWRGPIRGRALQVRGLRVRPRRLAGHGVLAHRQTWLAVPRQGLSHPQTDWPTAPLTVQLRPNGRPTSCDRRGPAARHGGLSTDALPVQPAFARRCRPARERAGGAVQQAAGIGMPSSPLLQMLRERIVPVARGCLRRDRAGRADYAVRAVYRFTLAEREIVKASVDGELAPRLRRCLRDAVDHLLVPRFTGVVHVTYPIRTLRETLPAQIELSVGTAKELEQVLSDPSAEDGARTRLGARETRTRPPGNTPSAEPSSAP